MTKFKILKSLNIIKNKVKKLKKVTRGKIIKKLVECAKQKAKLRDNNTCQMCNKYVTGSDCHGSHVIPVSAGSPLRWDVQNLKVLCYHCHLNIWHKNPLKAAQWFILKFPERAVYLEKMKLHYQDIGNSKRSILELQEELNNYM